VFAVARLTTASALGVEQLHYYQDGTKTYTHGAGARAPLWDKNVHPRLTDCWRLTLQLPPSAPCRAALLPARLGRAASLR
jgi:hypothetical protein